MTESTIQGLIFILTPCLILLLFGKPLCNTDNDDADEYEPEPPPRKYRKHYTVTKR